MNEIKLTAVQERQLKETLQHTHDVRQYPRSLTILKCARGKPVHEVALSLQVTRRQAAYRAPPPRKRHD